MAAISESRFLSSLPSGSSRRTVVKLASGASWDLHCVRAGSGTGVPIVMVHGGGTWAYTFRHLLKSNALLANRMAYAVDMPGHGYSTPLPGGPTTRFDMNDMVSALAQFVQATAGAQAVDLVGNSWGGGWCIAFAQTHPELVRSLVLLDSSGFRGREVFLYESLKWPLWGELSALIASRIVARDFYRKAFYKPSLVTEEMVDEAFRPIAGSYTNRIAQVKLMRGLDWTDVEQRIPFTQTPALVVWGKNDALWPVEMAYRFQRAMPAAQLVVFEECGHLPHEETPERLIPVVQAFLNSPTEP